MKNLSIRKSNEFAISQIKKGMKIKLRKTMTRKYFLKSIKLLNDSAPITLVINGQEDLGWRKKFFQVLLL